MSVAQPRFFFDGCPYLIFLQNGSGENECRGSGNESVSNPSVRDTVSVAQPHFLF